MKKYLIVGGGGFIGSNLCDELIKQHQVFVIDNFITSNKKNIEHLLSNKNFTLIERDITLPNTTELIISLNVDCIFHLASPASPIGYYQLPLETMKANSFGTHNILEATKQLKCSFLMASTSEIYGDPLEHPQTEEYYGNVNTIGLRSVYDESKRYAETATITYHKLYDLDTKIIRIFNCYGPRMDINDGRVIPSFINSIKNNKPFTIFGDGTQTRSFCYIDDMVQGLIKLMNSNYHYPINIGNPAEITILELAEIFFKILGKKYEFYYKEMTKNDPKKRKPDITKAKTILNWEPITSLENGLKNTFNYFKI